MSSHLKDILVLLKIIFIVSLISISNLKAQNEYFTVVLDAGHGGADSGNRGNGYFEKNIALNVTLEIGKALERELGIKVIYTRKTDIFVPLHKRAETANKADADLFISIHCNAVGKARPFGTETWVLGANNDVRNFEFAKRENEVIFLENNYKENYAGFDPNSPESTIAIGIEQEIYIEQSILLARKIEDKFKITAKRKSRGLKQGSLLVIRNTYMPSVLVELGFLTNKSEGAFLNKKKSQILMAKSIKEAIMDYKKAISNNVGKAIIKPQDTSKTVTNIEPKVSQTLNDKAIASNSETTTNEKQLKDNITLKIQIAASRNNLKTKPYNFKGLTPISKLKIGEKYKYYFGYTKNLTEAEQLKEKAISSGFSSSFIVAFKNNKPIQLQKAFK